MLGFVAGLLGYSLLFFGGVRPVDTLILGIAALVGLPTFIAWEILHGKSVPLVFLFLQVSWLSTMFFVGIKPALGLFAAIWSWEAARRSQKSVLRFFYVIFGIGVLEALLGLFQYLVAPGWIFGYINSLNSSSGTLINRNHFAGLLEMIVPISLGLAYIGMRGYEVGRPYLFLLGGAVMGLGIVFSLSRMAIVSLVVTLFFLSVLILLRASHMKRFVALGAGLAALFAAGVLWIGIDGILERYGYLLKESNIPLEGRAIVYRDTLDMIAANPRGIGAGKYQDVFRRYQTFHPEALFDHAHNDYLEFVAEWGILAGCLFWVCVFGVVVLGIRAFLRSSVLEQRGVILGCSGGMFAILLHSLTDFNLQIPSNAIVFFTLTGILLNFATQKKPRLG